MIHKLKKKKLNSFLANEIFFYMIMNVHYTKELSESVLHMNIRKDPLQTVCVCFVWYYSACVFSQEWSCVFFIITSFSFTAPVWYALYLFCFVYINVRVLSMVLLSWQKQKIQLPILGPIKQNLKQIRIEFFIHNIFWRRILKLKKNDYKEYSSISSLCKWLIRVFVCCTNCAFIYFFTLKFCVSQRECA